MKSLSILVLVAALAVVCYAELSGAEEVDEAASPQVEELKPDEVPEEELIRNLRDVSQPQRTRRPIFRLPAIFRRRSTTTKPTLYANRRARRDADEIEILDVPDKQEISPEEVEQAQEDDSQIRNVRDVSRFKPATFQWTPYNTFNGRPYLWGNSYMNRIPYRGKREAVEVPEEVDSENAGQVEQAPAENDEALIRNLRDVSTKIRPATRPARLTDRRPRPAVVRPNNQRTREFLIRRPQVLPKTF